MGAGGWERVAGGKNGAFWVENACLWLCCGWKGCRKRGVSKGVVVGRNARLGFEIRGWGGLINVIK